MKLTTITAILASVLLASTAQILLKSGMSQWKLIKFIAERDYVSLAFSMLTSFSIIGGLLVFALSIALWLLVLASVPLSTAYPFVALGICVTTFAGHILFGDSITLMRLAGVALIVGGISLIAANG